MANSGKCEFSGAETKGGKFIPGGDAKLKSALFDAANCGDAAAAAEAVHRGWATVDRFPEEMAAEITALAEHENVGDWHADRLNARWAAIEAGTDPRTAVSPAIVQADVLRAQAKVAKEAESQRRKAEREAEKVNREAAKAAEAAATDATPEGVDESPEQGPGEDVEPHIDDESLVSS